MAQNWCHPAVYKNEEWEIYKTHSTILKENCCVRRRMKKTEFKWKSVFREMGMDLGWTNRNVDSS